MPKVLVLYSTVDGQTGRIAARMADRVRAEGHDVTLQPAEGFLPEAFAGYDAVLVGAAIRYSRHSPVLVRLVRAAAATLARKPSAFFSVCLSAGGPGARPKTAQRYIDRFVRRTGWRPMQSASIGGALLYRRYNPFIRLLVRMFVLTAGGDTDTSRDYEYTDWQAVDRFAREFSRRIVELSRGPLVLQIIEPAAMDGLDAATTRAT